MCFLFCFVFVCVLSHPDVPFCWHLRVTISTPSQRFEMWKTGGWHCLQLMVALWTICIFLKKATKSKFRFTEVPNFTILSFMSFWNICHSSLCHIFCFVLFSLSVTKLCGNIITVREIDLNASLPALMHSPLNCVLLMPGYTPLDTQLNWCNSVRWELSNICCHRWNGRVYAAMPCLKRKKKSLLFLFKIKLWL